MDPNRKFIAAQKSAIRSAVTAAVDIDPKVMPAVLSERDGLRLVLVSSFFAQHRQPELDALASRCTEALQAA